MVSLTILNCISFGLYNQLKMTIQSCVSSLEAGGHHNAAWLLSHCEYTLAGALTGASASPISTPFEMVKVRLQLDNVTTKRYTGSWHCAMDIARREGLHVLWRGFIVNTTRESIFCGAYYGMYDTAKGLLQPLLSNSPHIAYLAIPLSGGLAGMSGWLTSYPLDVVKSNIQGALPGERKSFAFYIRQRWARGGFRAFFAGVGPSIVRAFIVSSIRFSAYEFTIAQLAKWRNRSES